MNISAQYQIENDIMILFILPEWITTQTQKEGNDELDDGSRSLLGVM